MSEEIALAVADRATEVAAIRARWADRRWTLALARDGDYIASATIETEATPAWTLDLDEPLADEIAFLETAAHAPDDIRGLLALIDRKDALLNDIRMFLDSRPTRTPLIDRLVTAIVAELT